MPSAHFRFNIIPVNTVGPGVVVSPDTERGSQELLRTGLTSLPAVLDNSLTFTLRLS